MFSTFHLAPGRAVVAATNEAPAAQAEDRNNFDKVCTKFREYVTPKSNVIFARFKFYNRTQATNESIHKFATDVKFLARDWCST